MTGNSKFTNGLFVALVAVTLATVALPGAVAQSGGFGTTANAKDFDTKYNLNTGGSEPNTWVHVDGDSDSNLDADESVYLATGGSLAGLDIRIANPPVDDLGSQVNSGDSDFGDNTRTLGSAGVGYYDADGDSQFSDGDTLFLDVNGGGTGTVDVNDVVLSGDDAGTIVTSGHSLLNNGITQSNIASTTGNLIDFFDADGDQTYSSGDPLYLDPDDTNTASVQDVRLGSDNFGETVASQEFDTTYNLMTATVPSNFAFVDGDSDGGLDSGEAVYLTSASDGASLSGLDVRVANPPAGDLGSQVSSGDGDFGDTVRRLSTTNSPGVGYYDADGDSQFSDGDTLFLDIDGSGTGAVSVNDVVLSGDDAGTIVTSGHSLLNNGLTQSNIATSNSNLVDFFDTDGDQTYSSGDRIYLDPDDSDSATVQDVRLSPSSFGQTVGAKEFDTTYDLGTGGSEPNTWVHVDGDSDSNLDADESVYLATGGSLAGLDIRIANPPEGDLGSQVNSGDSDFGDNTRTLGSAGVGYYDADGDSQFSDGDTLFLDVNGGGTGTVDVNDVVLSGDDAGTIVTSGHSLLNNNIVQSNIATSTGSLVDFFDADGDSTYSSGDTIYLDPDDGTQATQSVTVQDVRLGGPSPTQKDTQDTTDDTTDDTDDTDDTTDDTNQTADADGDGVADSEDNCPNTANAQQNDRDGDGVGNACDDEDNRDSDGDGVENFEDNCPNTPNAGQNDRDNDGVGNACDDTDDRPDADGDGIVDANDDCAQEAGPEANNGCPEETTDDEDTTDEEPEQETPALGVVAALAVIAGAAALLRRD